MSTKPGQLQIAIASVLAILAATACSSNQPTATEPAPTETTTPAATQTPTAIPAPAETPTAIPAPIETASQTSDGNDAMTEQESEAANRAFNRTDLEVLATATATSDTSYDIHAQIRALDRTVYLDPTLVIEPSSNVAITAQTQHQCEPTPAGATCLLANVSDKANSEEWTQLEFEATVTGPGPHTITITGASRGNPRGENDPDQTNNTVILELTNS